MARLILRPALGGICFIAVLILGMALVPATLQAAESSSGDSSLLDKLSFWKSERASIDEEVPQRIAVLPAEGPANEADREQIRLAVHNNLGATTFDLVKPYDYEHRVTELELNRSIDANTLSRRELAQALELDGLLEVRVLEVSKLYAVAYAEQEVGLELRLYSLKHDAVIWGDNASSSQGRGGMSLTILGMISNAVASTSVLRDTVKVALMNGAARKLARRMPVPSATKSRKRPPDIQAVLSNASDGPFSVGDTIQVFMQAEPGLVATFSMGAVVNSQALREVDEGEYAGRYVVQAGDQGEQLTGVVRATRRKDRARRQWGVPGRITIDTKAPQAVFGLTARPTVSGVQLQWNGNDDAEDYRIERAGLQEGRFSSVASVELEQFRDKDVERERRYVYRLTPVDAAGNEGETKSVNTAYIAPGPTAISGTIDNDRRFYPFGSPYRVSGEVTVMPGTTLRLAPGTIVEIAQGSRLLVGGRIEATGSAESPIRITGQDWTLKLSHTGTASNVFEHVRLRGPGSVIQVAGTSAHFRHSELTDLQSLVVDDAGTLVLEEVFRTDGSEGLRVHDGSAELKTVSVRNTEVGLTLNQRGKLRQQELEFADNEVHIKTASELRLVDVSFHSNDYREILNRMVGPVQLTWSGEKTNPLRRWLADAWGDIVLAVRDKQWAEALALIDALTTGAGQLPGDISTLADVIQAHARPEYSATSQPGKLVKQTGSKIELWLQEVPLGSVSGSLSSKSYVQQQAKSLATRAYLEFHGLNTRRCRPHCPLRLEEHLIASRPVWESMDNAYRTAWVLHVLDREKVQTELAAAGLTKVSGSELHIGVVDTANAPKVNERLVQILREQGLQVSQLDDRSLEEDTLTKAREDGVVLLLHAELALQRHESRVGESIQRFEGLLRVALYDTTSSKKLRLFSQTANALGFQSQKVRTNLVSKTVNGVRTPLIRYLVNVQPR